MTTNIQAARELAENKSATYREKHSERIKSVAKKWRDKNGFKKTAHRLLRSAVMSGELKKPDKCQQCSSTKPIQAHHEDYSKPLEVLWMCVSCHSKRHGVCVGVKKKFAIGESHGSSKLSERDVKRIKKIISCGSSTNRGLAHEYSVSESLICLVGKGRI